MADLIRQVAPGLPRRELVLAAPTTLPPPADAWVPGCFSVQIPLRGRIELALPGDTGWRLIGTRHLLAVCARSWSPRTQRHARRHLAFSFGQALQIHCFETPAGGGRRAPILAARITEPGAALQACCAAVVTCAERRPQPMVLHGLITAVLPLIADELVTAPHSSLVESLCAYLRASCRQELQRDDVAARFGIGGDHMTRLLKAATGCTFVDLLHRYRLDLACEQLRSSSATVEEIAADCGYGSASYFIRLFRRRFRVTPATWRGGWQSADGAAG